MIAAAIGFIAAAQERLLVDLSSIDVSKLTLPGVEMSLKDLSKLDLSLDLSSIGDATRASGEAALNQLGEILGAIVERSRALRNR